MVYAIYEDAFRFRDVGGASVQSLLLFAIIGVLTILQFWAVRGRVHYR